jgi:hypothetical protein
MGALCVSGSFGEQQEVTKVCDLVYLALRPHPASVPAPPTPLHIQHTSPTVLSACICMIHSERGASRGRSLDPRSGGVSCTSPTTPIPTAHHPPPLHPMPTSSSRRFSLQGAGRAAERTRSARRSCALRWGSGVQSTLPQTWWRWAKKKVRSFPQ